MTTSLRVADLEPAIYSLSLTVIAFILVELWRGKGTIHPPPHGPRRQKKTRSTKIGFRSTFHHKVVQTAVFDHCTELLGQFFSTTGGYFYLKFLEIFKIPNNVRTVQIILLFLIMAMSRND